MMVSLVGSLGCSALALIFPPLVDIMTLWPQRNSHKCLYPVIIKDLFLMCLGLIQLVVGTVLTVHSLVIDSQSQVYHDPCPL